jgi:hypothetical protein
MGEVLRCAHLAPLPLAVDSELIHALLYFIREHNIDRFFI